MSARRQSGWSPDYLHPTALAAPPRPAAPKRQRTPLWWEIIETALLTVILFVLVRTLVLNFRVDGQSMAPTLQHGQHLLINRVAYGHIDADLYQRWRQDLSQCVNGRCYLFRTPQRGDIVVFWPPNASERPFIKRIIGLPGESVEVRNGQVLVNGQPLAEPYIAARATYSAAAQTVPTGQYYVLGDNRNNSSDSHLFGMIPADHIVGQAWLSYWPLSHLGPVPQVTYAAPVRK